MGKTPHLAAAALVLLLPLFASASDTTEPAVDCSAFAATIEVALKAQARATAAAFGAKNAAASTSELRINNEWHRIAVNLQLMQAAGCQLPKTAITGREYLGSALACETALLGIESQLIKAKSSIAVKSPPECDSDSWSRGLGSEAALQEDVGVVPAPARTAVEGSGTVTLEQYNRVANGMTLDEVVAIVGRPGRRSSAQSVALRSIGAVEYVWENPALASYMTVTIVDGQVVAKYQAWLN